MTHTCNLHLNSLFPVSETHFSHLWTGLQGIYLPHLSMEWAMGCSSHGIDPQAHSKDPRVSYWEHHFYKQFPALTERIQLQPGILEGFMYLWNCLPVTAVSQGYTGVTMEITGPNWQGLEFPKLSGEEQGGLHLYLPQSLTEIQHFLPWRVQRTNLVSVHRTCDFVTNGYRYSHTML